jgi:hypothetical protein
MQRATTSNDETGWATQDWIRRNLGVGPYALQKLAGAGRVLTKTGPCPRRLGHPLTTFYFVDHVKASYVRGKGRQPAVIPEWQKTRTRDRLVEGRVSKN